MPANDFYVNIHCHPTMKPFGKSFPNGKVQNRNRKKKDSSWYYNPPSPGDKAINYLAGLTKFAQSDFSSSAYGNVRVVCASLYPPEKGFFINELGTGPKGDLLLDFVTEMGIQRINDIQTCKDYFKDLTGEYDFLLQLHNEEITLTDGRKYKYVLVNNYNELSAVLAQEGTIAVIVTIEGAHCFGCGIDPKNNPFDEATLLKNIKTVKSWEYPPFFITFAHHFYNELCGHASSLSGIVADKANQEHGMDEGFTDLGKKALKILLDNTSGKRILIDIKHMSRKARLQYFDMLDAEYSDENIPVIVSHGGVIGSQAHAYLFNNDKINFYDDELLRVGRSDGLFGIQLDERRIASEAELKKARGNIVRGKIIFSRRKILYNWSRLVWRQAQHIAELLDKDGRFAWGNICLGTDYDGIVDPINGYWTHEDMPDLDSFLLMHAHNYMKSDNGLQPINKIDAEEIVSRIMGLNAMNFFQKHFK